VITRKNRVAAPVSTDRQRKHIEKLKEKIAKARANQSWWREFQLRNQLKIAERKLKND
jgi:hypothetical protein